MTCERDRIQLPVFPTCGVIYLFIYFAVVVLISLASSLNTYEIVPLLFFAMCSVLYSLNRLCRMCARRKKVYITTCITNLKTSIYQGRI